MSKNTFIALIVLIAVMPIVYLMLGGIEPEEIYSFRGMPVQTVEPENGTVIVPSEVENQNNVPMSASFNAGFIEKLSGLKPPFADKLVLSIDSITNSLNACNEDGTIPKHARFDLASTCAKISYEKMQLDHKTALLVDPQEQFIIFGATSNNQVQLFHNGMIASYSSKDMTQGDRKREACIVRIMMDYLIGKTANVESSCPAATQG